MIRPSNFKLSVVHPAWMMTMLVVDEVAKKEVLGSQFPLTIPYIRPDSSERGVDHLARCSASLAARRTKTFTMSRLYSAEPRLWSVGLHSVAATSPISRSVTSSIVFRAGLPRLFWLARWLARQLRPMRHPRNAVFGLQCDCDSDRREVFDAARGEFDMGPAGSLRWRDMDLG